jgi:hypothetical protein
LVCEQAGESALRAGWWSEQWRAGSVNLEKSIDRNKKEHYIVLGGRIYERDKLYKFKAESKIVHG